jgi:hypothetical protein
MVVEPVPSTPSHIRLPCRRPLRQTRPVGGGGECRRGSAKQACMSAESAEVEDTGPGRGRIAGPRSRSSPSGRGRGHHRRDEVEVTPLGRGRGRAIEMRLRSRRRAEVGCATPVRPRSLHSAEVDRAVVEVPHVRRGGGALSTMGRRRHRTTILAGARRRRAGLLLCVGTRRAFHHRASGCSGGAPEQWLLRPPHVGEESKCCRVQANEVSDRKANTRVQANEA